MKRRIVDGLGWLVFGFGLLTMGESLAAPEVSLPAEISQVPGETPEQRDARMAWWREARFGMFVHWGLYSGLAGNWDGKPLKKKAGMEWIQKFVGADRQRYAEQAIPKFQPQPGFARAWMQLARRAGCGYVVFTTKHHDGFALHDSNVSDYDAGSILGRDLVAEIVAAARTEGLRVGFYHSLIDWQHSQYDYLKAKGLPHPFGRNPSPNGPRDHARYIEFLHAQVGELLQNYGKIDVMWWDFSSPGFQGDAAWGASKLMADVRRMQPGILVNNRLYAKQPPPEGLRQDRGDFSTPEQKIPATGVAGVDWETCMTLNGTWGYSEHDHDWKTADQLIRHLVEVTSKGGNFLLNIGPKGDGSLDAETVSRFRAIGAWMEVNGEAVRGCLASPIPAQSWGRATRKGGQVYLCIQEWPQDGVLDVPLGQSFSKGTWLAKPREIIHLQGSPGGLKVTLPSRSVTEAVSVIRLDP